MEHSSLVPGVPARPGLFVVESVGREPDIWDTKGSHTGREGRGNVARSICKTQRHATLIGVTNSPERHRIGVRWPWLSPSEQPSRDAEIGRGSEVPAQKDLGQGGIRLERLLLACGCETELSVKRCSRLRPLADRQL